MMFSNQLQPSVLHPTHITDKTSTLIDKTFVNNGLESSIQSGNILSLISDHLPQFYIISDFKCDYRNLTHKVYNYSHFDANMLLADCTETNFSITDVSSDMKDKCDKFLPYLLGLVTKDCPQKKLNKNRLKLKTNYVIISVF